MSEWADRVYFYRGRVERWRSSRKAYVWMSGYSARGATGGVEYPWLTKAECHAEAHRMGCRAVFKEES